MKFVQQVAVPISRHRIDGERAKGFRSRRSSALLLVLGMIVLLSALILAFLASVGTELTTSQTYANGATVKQLADSATQLVISQVVSATGNTNSTLAWASQPGMIRTYDTSGNPALFYKLYSSSSMITNAAASMFNPAAEAPPANWDSANNAGLYTDLNSPVMSGGTNYFPIIDPRALAATTAASVEGFNYTKTVDQVALPADAGGTAGQRLPMPVLWLYVLQNGALITPVSGSAGTVTFSTADTALMLNGANPIVGRIAFWTDDETCKVNVNTASEGTFWDRSWVNNTTDQNFSMAIPAQNEFQRYPGHPAKTCLSSVFGPLGFPSPWPNSAWYNGITTATQKTYTNELAAYYGLAPRIADGGTEGGNITEATNPTKTNSAPNPAFITNVVDGDRLYASADEMLYNPARTTNTQNSTAMSNAVLEKAKFFITAHSRAPELNLFGKPRMTLWPLQMDTTKRNAKDALIAFCSTIGGNPYYFQRYSTYTSPATPGAGSPNSSSQSATLDWTGVPRNQSLYSYISQLTQQNIPGFGGSFAAKYPNSCNQIITEMFDQIRSGVNAYSNGLTPAYNYAPTYLDPGEGQVVPLMPPAGTPGAGTHGFGRFVTITGAAIDFYRSNQAFYNTNPATSSTNPVVLDPTYVEVPDANGRKLNPNGIMITPAPQIGAVLILNPFTASPGFPPWSPNVQYVITGLDTLTITSPSGVASSTRLGFTSPLKNTVTSRADFSGIGNCCPIFGLVSNFRYAVTTGMAGTDATKVPGNTDPILQYPFAVPTATSPGNGVPLGATDQTFDFSGGTITVKIYSGSDGSPTLTTPPATTPIQTITMTFPPVKGLRVPTTPPIWAATAQASSTGFTAFGQSGSQINDVGSSLFLNKPWHDWLPFYTPIPASTSASTPPGPYVRAYAALGNGVDTKGNAVIYEAENIARGIESDVSAVAHGDYRVYAALSQVPAGYFKACANYDFPAGGPQQYNNVQSLRDQGTDGSGGGGFGFDSAEPFGLYPHYVRTPGNTSAARDQVQAQTTATGTLIPPNLLATYGSTDQNGSTTGDHEYRATAHPAVPNGLQGAFLNNGNYGDWDNATGLLEDGPFINKPDEGNSATASNTANFENLSVYLGGGIVDISGGYYTTGFGVGDYQAESGQTFSPSRQISSAVMFGSLPTGIDPTGGTAPQPWQTLLFCANPASNSSPGATAGASHPGFGTPSSGPPYVTPPDHLMLDLFTMPVVEPYAISEPLSTAGKINMNYQILPFTYITRDTGVRAVLKSTRIMAIPQSASTVTAAAYSYKDGQSCKYEMRYNINPGTETATPQLSDGTLYGFQTRFNNGDIFRCASEICGIYLVPQLIPTLSVAMSYPPGSTPPSTYAGTAAWWNNFLLTGDNTREFPYGDLYARLTTKSNTYTVHVRVQTLKKVTGTSSTQWVEGRDLVTGEYRGSSLIERYIDTSDTTLPDFAAAGSASAEGYYKIRIVSSKKFEP